MDKETVDIENGRLDLVEAEFINIRQSTVRSLDGGHVEMHQVGAISIDGERVEVTQGAAVVMKGENLTLNQSMGVLAAGANLDLNYSLSSVSLASGNIDVDKSIVGFMAAKEISSSNSTALVMIGRNINGNVTTLLDWKSALALGAMAGGVFGLFSLFKNR